MHSIESYLRRQSTAQLEVLLQMNDLGCGGYTLQTILLICYILAERDPSGKPAMERYQAFLQLHNLKKKTSEPFGSEVLVL